MVRLLEDCNENHPLSRLRMPSPREFIADQTVIAGAFDETGGETTTRYSASRLPATMTLLSDCCVELTQ